MMSTFNVSFLQDLLNTVADQGRALLPKSLFASEPEEGIQRLVEALMTGHGEATGVAIARQVLNHYDLLGPDERRAFFRYLAETQKPDSERVAAAAKAYLEKSQHAQLADLQSAVESPLLEFFRRLNLAPCATPEIVAMRRDLLNMPPDDQLLASVDATLRQLLVSWFTRGFLVLRRIDWQTPAAILEKIIAYEAVHEIKGWDDLRRRLDPADRRCFAFFHPSLIDEPLIFVQVALMDETPRAIAPLLNAKAPSKPQQSPTTAVFYSISNCQEGLKGISFGSFLIKQVVEELARELDSLNTFVTLSPVPGFASWLRSALADETAALQSDQEREALRLLDNANWHKNDQSINKLKPVVRALGAQYLLQAKDTTNRPVDSVARFHLGNGARLDAINWLGDDSQKGRREAHGLMVNYRYDLKEIEKNHEAFASDGQIAASRAVRTLLRNAPKSIVTDTESPPGAVPTQPDSARKPKALALSGTSDLSEK